MKTDFWDKTDDYTLTELLDQKLVNKQKLLELEASLWIRVCSLLLRSNPVKSGNKLHVYVSANYILQLTSSYKSYHSNCLVSLAV